MEQKAEYQLMDEVISTAITNLIVEAVRNEEIIFKNFNTKSVRQAFGFEMAYIFGMSTNKVFYLDLNPIRYFFFRIKNWSIRHAFKRYTRDIKGEPMEIEKILDHMVSSMGLDESIYNLIYKSYYKSGAENRSFFKQVINKIRSFKK